MRVQVSKFEELGIRRNLGALSSCLLTSFIGATLVDNKDDGGDMARDGIGEETRIHADESTEVLTNGRL